MTRNELYDLEIAAIKNIDLIKKEQAEFVKGVEHGIELMFREVREFLRKEDERSNENAE